LEELREENRNLKQNLMSIQEHLRETIDEALYPIQGLLATPHLQKQFRDLVPQVRVLSDVSSMQLNLPSTPVGQAYLHNTFRDNLQRFRTFT